MSKIIKLAFRIIIDEKSTHIWDKYIFEDTYFEYKLQHQIYEDKANPVDNYYELLIKNPNAERIPYILSSAIENYILQLNGVIKSLTDVLGNTFFPFEFFKLDLVNSHKKDASKHKIGITFYTPKLLLLDIIDNKYLLSKEIEKENNWETFMLQFHPQISISYYENHQ